MLEGKKLTSARKFPALAFIVALLAIPGAASADSRFEPGQYQVREFGPTAHPHSVAMCISDPAQLLRREHPGIRCTQTVLAQDPMGLTVHYTCAAKGWGRSTLHFETPRLVQLETQGIANGLPFSYSAELRRTGDCGKSP